MSCVRFKCQHVQAKPMCLPMPLIINCKRAASVNKGGGSPISKVIFFSKTNFPKGSNINTVYIHWQGAAICFIVVLCQLCIRIDSEAKYIAFVSFKVGSHILGKKWKPPQSAEKQELLIKTKIKLSSCDYNHRLKALLTKRSLVARPLSSYIGEEQASSHLRRPPKKNPLEERRIFLTNTK